MHGFLPLFLVLHGDWFCEPTPALAKIVCASERHILPNNLPTDFKDTVPNNSFSIRKPQVADLFDLLRQSWS